MKFITNLVVSYILIPLITARLQKAERDLAEDEEALRDNLQILGWHLATSELASPNHNYTYYFRYLRGDAELVRDYCRTANENLDKVLTVAHFESKVANAKLDIAHCKRYLKYYADVLVGV